eukprot:4959727-Amphidinium_carterae.2
MAARDSRLNTPHRKRQQKLKTSPAKSSMKTHCDNGVTSKHRPKTIGTLRLSVLSSANIWRPKS